MQRTAAGRPPSSRSGIQSKAQGELRCFIITIPSMRVKSAQILWNLFNTKRRPISHLTPTQNKKAVSGGGLSLSKKQVKKMNRKELAAHLRSIGVRLNYTACSLRESVDFPLPPKFILCAYMQVSCQGSKKVLMRRVLEYIKTTELKTKSATTNSHSLPAAEAAAPNDFPFSNVLKS